MGACLSTTKVIGSSSNATAHHRKGQQSSATTTTSNAKNESQKPNNQRGQQQQQQVRSSHPLKFKEKPSTRSQSGIIPCGKRTDFGYHKDFDQRYTIGKLLGHGQFGYTYVATDEANGDRVAVKKIDKNKVFFIYFFMFL